MQTKEQAIAEMREVMREKCRTMQEGGLCAEELPCSQCEAEALYDKGYRKVDVEKLTTACVGKFRVNCTACSTCGITAICQTASLNLTQAVEREHDYWCL